VRTALLDAASVADLLITIERCGNGNFRHEVEPPRSGVRAGGFADAAKRTSKRAFGI
jgi:hypothetical protein